MYAAPLVGGWGKFLLLCVNAFLVVDRIRFLLTLKRNIIFTIKTFPFVFSRYNFLRTMVMFVSWRGLLWVDTNEVIL